VGESAAPAFGGLGPGFSHGARPKPPPVAAGRLEPKAPDETAKYEKEKRLKRLPAIPF